MSARTERCLPFLVATVSAVVAGLVLFLVVGVEPGTSGIPAAGMTFGIVVAGFAATQRNMLIGMGQTRVLRFLARTGYDRSVLSYLTDCVGAGLATTGVSLAGFFLGKDAIAWSAWLVSLAFVVSLVIALMVRNEVMSLRIVSHFIKEQGKQENT